MTLVISPPGTFSSKAATQEICWKKLLGIVFVCGAGATSAMATADPAPQAALWGKVKASGAGNPSPGSCSPAMASQEGSEPSYLMHEEHWDDLFIVGIVDFVLF